MARGTWRALADRSADPVRVGHAIERLLGLRPELAARFDAQPRLTRAVVACTAASRALTRLIEADEDAIEVLADLGHRPPLVVEDGPTLVTWKQRELMRVAALDLIGEASFETTVA